MATKDDIHAEITSDGVAYCENDSFTFKGHAVINNNYNFSIENSPGANIVNQSQNVNINTQINEIDKTLSELLAKIKSDPTIDENRKKEILECSEEIRNNLELGKIPKFGMKNLLSLISDISSVSGLALTLYQYVQ